MTKLFNYSLFRDLIVFSVILSLVALIGGWAVYQTQAASTTMDVTMTAGSLTITAPGTATFTGKIVLTTDQDTDGVIGDATDNNTTGVEVTDARGSGAGWSLTMTTTNLTIREDDVMLSGSNDDVVSSGTYDGALGIQTQYPSFVVEITTGGIPDGATAEYSYWKPGTDPSGAADDTLIKATDSAVELSNGVSIAFTLATTYVSGDKWSILVDVFPYNDTPGSTGLEISPSAIHVDSGSTEGVNAGSANQFFAGSAVTSDALTVMTATADHGQGDYFVDIDMVQDIHKNSLDGQYTSTATLTGS